MPRQPDYGYNAVSAVCATPDFRGDSFAGQLVFEADDIDSLSNALGGEEHAGILPAPLLESAESTLNPSRAEHEG